MQMRQNRKPRKVVNAVTSMRLQSSAKKRDPRDEVRVVVPRPNKDPRRAWNRPRFSPVEPHIPGPPTYSLRNPFTANATLRPVAISSLLENALTYVLITRTVIALPTSDCSHASPANGMRGYFGGPPSPYLAYTILEEFPLWCAKAQSAVSCFSNLKDIKYHDPKNDKITSNAFN